MIKSSRKNVADPAGVEPSTSWSSVRCTSNWTTQAGKISLCVAILLCNMQFINRIWDANIMSACKVHPWQTSGTVLNHKHSIMTFFSYLSRSRAFPMADCRCSQWWRSQPAYLCTLTLLFTVEMCIQIQKLNDKQCRSRSGFLQKPTDLDLHFA